MFQRSSRGRIIKPARSTISPYLTNCNDLYTYDWHGNFQGVNSSVIDLTLCDDPLPTKRRIKKEPVEQKSNKNLDHTTEAPPTSVVPPTTTKAPPTTVPTKKRVGRPRKAKVCDEVPMHLSKRTTAAGRESDAETRHRARQPAPRDAGRRREEKEIRRERTASGGSVHDSNAETRHRARQPSGDEKRREKEIRRERTASGGSRDSDAETRHRGEHARQSGQNGRSKAKGIDRERKASGGSVADHKIDQASAGGVGKKAYASSAGGKENRRGVSRVLLSSEGESEGEINTKSRQRARKNIRSKSRKLYNTESETASDQSEVDTTNERGQLLSVAAPRQQKQASAVVDDPIDAFSPLLSPARKKSRGERGDKMSQSELGHRKEHKPSKLCAVRPSDPMNGFSPLLSPVKKKSRWGGGVEERKSCTSSATAGEPRDNKMTQTELRNLRQ